MAIFLTLIAASTLLFEKSLFPLENIGWAVLTAVVSDILLLKLRKIKLFLPSAALVSGLIIGLLSAPTLSWYQIVVASMLAMVGKNFLRFDSRHIFNPAAFGLILTALLFQTPVSWWGVSFQKLELDLISLFFFLILLFPGLVSVVAMARYKILLGFFALYLMKSTLFDPTVLFFSLVMLPEPMTSPHKPIPQLLFGASVAIVAILLSLSHTDLSLDPLLTGLLVGNLLFFRFR